MGVRSLGIVLAVSLTGCQYEGDEPLKDVVLGADIAGVWFGECVPYQAFVGDFPREPTEIPSEADPETMIPNPDYVVLVSMINRINFVDSTVLRGDSYVFTSDHFGFSDANCLLQGEKIREGSFNVVAGDSTITGSGLAARKLDYYSRTSGQIVARDIYRISQNKLFFAPPTSNSVENPPTELDFTNYYIRR